MKLGRREAGFYMEDVDRKPRRIMRKHKDSLGKKRVEVVNRIVVVTEEGDEAYVTLAGNEVNIRARDGQIHVLPRASNVVDVRIGKHADF